MIQKPIISFVLGLLVAGIISGFVYFILFLETFDLFGTNELIDPEGKHGKIFYTSLIMTIFSLAVFISLVRYNNKFTALGMAIPNLVVIFMLLKFGGVYLDKSNYYAKFNKQVWIDAGEKPIKMARGLVKDEVLIGFTKSETFEMLGQERIEKRDSIEFTRYWTENGDCALSLTFEKDKVTKANLVVND